MGFKRQKKAQMEIEGCSNRLTEALDDLVERLDELDKITESIKPAKERAADIMFEERIDKIFHKGRHLSLSSPEIKPKLRCSKAKSS
jgi:DNA-binding transcriptional regulator GbsR (MarR family)